MAFRESPIPTFHLAGSYTRSSLSSGRCCINFGNPLSTKKWPELETIKTEKDAGKLVINPLKGLSGDFGVGFYTYPLDDSRTLAKAFEWAQRKAKDAGGSALILPVLVKRTDLEVMKRSQVRGPIDTKPEGQLDVLTYSAVIDKLKKQQFAGRAVVWGAISKNEGGANVPRKDYPHQYKFELQGVPKLKPLPPIYIP